MLGLVLLGEPHRSCLLLVRSGMTGVVSFAFDEELSFTIRGAPRSLLKHFMRDVKLAAVSALIIPDIHKLSGSKKSRRVCLSVAERNRPIMLPDGGCQVLNMMVSGLSPSQGGQHGAI